MIIDAHQHFWNVSRTDYGWLTPAAGVLYRDYLPGDLLPLLRANGVTATVLVQAAPSEDETRYLLSLAREHSFIAGVIGWADFEARDASGRIADLVAAGGGLLKGLRPMIQDIADPNWASRPILDSAFEALCAHDLVFDALVRPVHLPALRIRLARSPRLRVVVDHAAKPAIEAGEFDLWAAEIEQLARNTGVHCKLSGLLTEAGRQAGPTDLAPYAGQLFDCFGSARMIWGSDWPVLNAVSDYSRWMQISRELIGHFASESAPQVLAYNALRVYKLKVIRE